MSWGLTQWQPQNYFTSYARNKFFVDGHLDSKKIEQYGSIFGIKKDDFDGDENISQVGKYIYDKQLDAFGGVEPAKNAEVKSHNSTEDAMETDKNNEMTKNPYEKQNQNSPNYGTDAQKYLNLVI